MKKRVLAVIIAMILLLGLNISFAEEASVFNAHQKLLFETVKWNVNLPKDAQILHAEEYICKMTQDIPVRVLLAEITQNPDIEMMYGTSSRLLLIDLETMQVVDHKSVVWPESSDIATKEEALNMLFSCYDSYLQGYNEFIYADHEIVTPVAEDEIAAINEALNHYFLPQSSAE